MKRFIVMAALTCLSAAFRRSVKEALPLAAKGRLVTFGIKPTGPATGYGYIKRGTGYDVAAFVEKPDLDTAKLYLDSGEYAWNSGMFMVRLSTWFEELKRFEPEIARICEAAHAKGKNDGDFFRVDKETFARCPSNSIDYAVMEKTDRAAVVELDAGWSDVGAWSSLWENGTRAAWSCEKMASGAAIRQELTGPM